MPGWRDAHRLHYNGHPLDMAPFDMCSQFLNMADGGGEGGLQYYFNHFFEWTGPVGDSAAPGTGGWIVTSVDGGGDAGEVVDVLDNNRYGILRILSNDADNDNTQIQMNGSGWRYSVGQRMWFVIRIALQDADDGEVAFGLTLESDVDVVNTFPADGIFFEKAETATDFDFHAILSSTDTENTPAGLGLTLADDTMVTMGFYVDPVGNIVPFTISDAGRVTRGTAITQGDTGIPDDVSLTPFVQVQTGTTATRYVDVDYIGVAAERA